MCWSSRSSFVPLLLVCASAACAAKRPPLPEWAIHARPPIVFAQRMLAQLEPQLLRELASEHYEPMQTDPEQIAALAVHELRLHHAWDAAVLLSLASFRRLQQAAHLRHHAVTSGLSIARGRVGRFLNENAYHDLIEDEERSFAGARFDAEIERIATAVGSALAPSSHRRDLARIAMGNLYDEFAAVRAIEQRKRARQDQPEEALAHPELALAVRAYLERYVTRRRDDRVAAHFAAHYLALVPLRAFRLSALEHAPEPFQGIVVSAGVALHARHPEVLAAALASEAPETRGQAAIVLGVAQDLPQLPGVEAALKRERDDFARLSQRYALASFGELDQLDELVAALDGGDPAIVEHAAKLVQWLPAELKLQVPEGALVQTLRRRDHTLVARYVTAITLCEVGQERPLSEAALAELANAVADLEHHPGAVRQVADAFGALHQLDRGKVLAALRARQAPLDGWLARLGRLTLPSDLPLLDAMLKDRELDAEKRRWIAQAAQRIPGAEAQASLERWFERYPDLRTSIALLLVAREDLDKEALRKLARRVDDPLTGVFGLALGDVNARVQVHEYAQRDDAPSRFASALAIKFFGSADDGEALWRSVSYHDARYYPADVVLRTLSLSALVDLELNRPHGALGTGRTADLGPLHAP